MNPHAIHHRKPFPHSGQPHPVATTVPDDVLGSRQFASNRKNFDLTLRKNKAGKFLRIREDIGPRHNLVCIPEECFAEFVAAINELCTSESPE